MTRPEIIRADSVDLQDPNAPSAQDHTRKLSINTAGPAPHQAEALREASAEAAEQQLRSPRVSKEWTTQETQGLHQYGDDLAQGVTSSLTGANLQQQDALAVAQNGGLTGSTAEDAEMADAEGDDGMDDDMMDKISSSPSIEDGGYSLPPLSPQRVDFFARERHPDKVESGSQACSESSSSPTFPLPPVSRPVGSQARYHLPGEYLDNDENDSNYDDSDSEDHSHFIAGGLMPSVESYDGDYILDEYSASDEEGSERSASDYPRPSNPGPHAEHLLDSHDDPLTIPYVPSDEDDDDYEIPLSATSRFIDSGWGGECLQETEDIDFEFVYALHTFVATVEGQANATKGNTMVLLDDSNSYWWLVRVVKDSSIGYLPAEHIETPTERLARLNKHRNIDLASTMLSDQPEKSKNPLKKALRKRNAKTVTFAPPTYVEASDVDYSSDEEEDGEGNFYGQNAQEPNGDQQNQDQAQVEDEIVATEPLKPRTEIREVKAESAEPDAVKSSSDPGRTSDEIFEGKLESNKSRNGTVRNTDSFFKDDTVETRKITLTPNLLRDDSSTSTRASGDSKEFQKRPSLDKLEKDSSSDKRDKKAAKEKKEKDKKPGMLSGLFKRKDKKSKAQDEDADDIMGKKSGDNERTSPSPSKDPEEISSSNAPAMDDVIDMQRQPSKLQKQPRSESSPVRKAGQTREPKVVETQQAPAPERPPPAESVQAPSMRLVQSDSGSEETIKGAGARDQSPESTRGPTPVLSTPKEQKSGISKMLSIRSGSSSSSEPKPIKVKKAKSRVELDDFDSSDDARSPVDEPIRGPSKQSQRPIPGSFPDSYIQTPQVERGNAMEERLSESPVEVSPIEASQSYPPALMGDSSSQDDHPSPISSPSPDLIDADEAREKKGSSTTSTSTAAWSDSHLRTFFDDDADIKDLLVVVYDKSGVVPAGPDHPITGNLFRDENAKLADITNRLDGMLGDWLARKMRTQGTR